MKRLHKSLHSVCLYCTIQHHCDISSKRKKGYFTRNWKTEHGLDRPCDAAADETVKSCGGETTEPEDYALDALYLPPHL